VALRSDACQANGFTDASPELRELSIVSLALLAPRLSARILDTALGFIGALLNDPEPGIRTNTVVCLAKVAPYLSQGTRARVLLPGFGARLRDPFPPARVAAVRGMLCAYPFPFFLVVSRPVSSFQT
jgi:SCY1-like protein 1